MTHLTREELERWWQRGDPADRERVVGHLAACDECGSLYGRVIDGLDPTAADLPEVRRALVRRGVRVYRPARGWWPLPRWVVATAALTGLVVAISVPLLRTPAAPVTDTPVAVRGSALQALGPVGLVEAPVTFRWASPVTAASYRVEIRDGDRVLSTLLTGDESVELPAADLARLDPGRTYSWLVVALTAEGDEIMRTEAQRFSVDER
jgi:hypothetical protein